MISVVSSTDGSFQLQLESEQRVVDEKNGFEAWLAKSFSEMSAQGPDTDPDNDGLTNLLEYRFGTSPSQPSAMPLSVSSETEGLRVSYQRRIDGELVDTLEISTDLVEWQQLSGSFIVSDSAVEGFETVTRVIAYDSKMVGLRLLVRTSS